MRNSLIVMLLVFMVPAVASAQFVRSFANVNFGSSLEETEAVCSRGKIIDDGRYVCNELADPMNFETNIFVSFSEEGRVNDVRMESNHRDNLSHVWHLYHQLFQLLVRNYGTPVYNDETNELTWNMRGGRITFAVVALSMHRGYFYLDFQQFDN